jgi:NAD(P)-dependent dehydrogenase (short-subunit alcohol dehydrogenase family)
MHYSAHRAAQLNMSLVGETKSFGVGCHLISPGMIITRLLLRHANNAFVRTIFNLLADPARDVARTLAPQILATYGTGTRIDYLTRRGVVFRLLTFWRFRGRHFDAAGRCTAQYE